ncbi:hypothetical protein [Methylorubrum zatmanii]
MSQIHMSGLELLFVATDATWRSEAAKVLDRKPNDFGLTLRPEARGKAGTLLRTAFEIRERAHASWGREPEKAPLNEVFPASHSRLNAPESMPRRVKGMVDRCGHVAPLLRSDGPRGDEMVGGDVELRRGASPANVTDTRTRSIRHDIVPFVA